MIRLLRGTELGEEQRYASFFLILTCPEHLQKLTVKLKWCLKKTGMVLKMTCLLVNLYLKPSINASGHSNITATGTYVYIQ